MVIADATGGRRRRYDDLDALSGRKRSGQERGFFGDPLACRIRDELGEPITPMKVGKWKVSRSQPERVSRKASPGRLMQISVTSSRDSSGCNTRKVSASDEIWAACTNVLGVGLGAVSMDACSASHCEFRPSRVSRRGVQGVDTAKIDIACDQDFNAIALRLLDGGRNIERPSQHLGRDIARGGGI